MQARAALGRLAAAWRRYWFGTDGRISVEVVRIAIAVGALVTWQRAAASSYGGFLELLGERAYHPFGILRLFGTAPPPAPFLELCKWLALASSLAMLVGLASRASTVISLLTMLVMTGMREGMGDTWHHSYTPLLATHLAFVLAPCGRMMAVDAVLRRWRGKPTGAEVPRPAWPAILAQLVAAIPYGSAAAAKLIGARGLDWALSDSLRHHILARYDWTGHPRTPVADLLVHSEPLWKAAALGNLMSQLAPLVSCLFVRRPWIRFALGAFFVIETIALDKVMDLPNYQWLPLAVVFVDWDRLVAWVRRRRDRDHVAAQPAEPVPPPRWVSPVIAVFIPVHFAITFGPVGLDQRLNSFPISQYRMFSTVRAKRPYSRHQSWEFETVRFTVEGPGGAIPGAADRLAAKYYRDGDLRSPVEIQRLLNQARRRLASRRTIRSITAWYTVLQAPAYPAPPDLVPHPIGILGRLRGQRFESLLGSAGVDENGRTYLTLAPTGLEVTGDLKVTYLLGLDPIPRPIAVEKQGGRLYYAARERGRYLFIAEVGGEHFILAEARQR
jgi:hypothetical protein